MTDTDQQRQPLLPTSAPPLADNDADPTTIAPKVYTDPPSPLGGTVGDDPTTHPSDLYGFTLMALSTLGFSGMSFFVHVAEISFDFSPAAALFIRAIVTTVLSAAYILGALDVNRLIDSFTWHQLRLLFLRGLFGSIGIACLFKSLQLLPVGEAITVFFCGPVLTMMLSHAVLSEHVTTLDIVSAGVSFAGVLMISRPHLGFGGDLEVGRLAGAAYALAAAFLSAVSYVIVRSLGTGIHFMTSVFSLGLASIATATFLGGAMGPTQLITGGLGTALVILSSLFAFAGQCCLNKGLQHCRAGPGVLVRNLDVPVTYALGICFLKERPAVLSIIGSSFVVLATIMLGIRQIFDA